MAKLSVNINKIALLRNSRGGNLPDVLQAALDIERFGAQGITVHPRPDERHIRRADVYALADRLSVEFNVEGYPSPPFVEMVLAVRPTQVTLVPDPPGVLTSDQGWKLQQGDAFGFVAGRIAELRQAGIRVSLFVDAEPDDVRRAAEAGADRVELYTGPYAEAYRHGREEAVAPYEVAARAAADVSVGLNAGHDLNLENLSFFQERIPNLLEVSIGHALVADALYLGLEETIRRYRACLVD